MVYTSCRVLLCALALALLALPAVAAQLVLRDGAVIDVREFAFPVQEDAERSLPEVFHAQLVFALQKNGLVVFQKDADGKVGKTPDASMPLLVTPLTDSTTENSGAPEKPADTANTGNTPEIGEAAARAENDGTSEDTPKSVAEAPEDHSSLPDDPVDVAGDMESIPMPPHRETVPSHILEGRVTLFRETVGTPTRVGGAIRIRTEASLHCTYKVREAATGKVLLTATSSGSSAKVTAQAQDIDAALAALSTKAMTAAAGKIAANLSGSPLPEQENTSDRSYYQDSPGKRLKSK